jgi:hypothetical protein
MKLANSMQSTVAIAVPEPKIILKIKCESSNYKNSCNFSAKVEPSYHNAFLEANVYQ